MKRLLLLGALIGFLIGICLPIHHKFTVIDTVGGKTTAEWNTTTLQEYLLYTGLFNGEFKSK